MHSRLSSVLTAMLLAAAASPVSAKSQPDPLFTLQVGSFSEKVQAERLAFELARAGESPVLDTVEIAGRGLWTRIFVGLFPDADTARQKGVTLLARGIIREFLIKTIDSTESLTRPRRSVSGDWQPVRQHPIVGLQAPSEEDKAGSGSPGYNRTTRFARSDKTPVSNGRGPSQKLFRDAFRPSLPIAAANVPRLGQKIDTNLIPRPDPVSLAFKLVTGEARHDSGRSGRRGGLWVTGDTAEGLARLRWIAGEENSHAIKLDPDGRVRFDTALLAKAAGRGVTTVEDPLEAVEYISSNEGLLLLVQVSQGRSRYLLHMGRLTPTSGEERRYRRKHQP